MRKQAIRPEGVEHLGLYTHAFRVSGGDLVICSGMTSVDADGRTVGPGDAAAQTRQIFENLKRVLGAAGATLDDVISIRIYSTDMANLRAINEVRLEYLSDPLPVSTHVGVTALAKPDRLLEIEVMALVPSEEEA